MGVFSMGAEPTAVSPSKISDQRAVAYDQGVNASGNKNKVNINRDQASQFAGAGAASILGDGNRYSFSLLDGGAIAAAFDFASKTSDSAKASFDQILNTGQGLVEQGVGIADTAKADRKTLMIGAGVVVALVALWILNK